MPWGESFIYGLDGNWRSKYFYYPTISSQKTNPDPLLQQEPYAIYNAHLTWNTDASKHLAFELSVLNLADEEYTNHGLPISNGSGQTNSGRPRSFLLSVLAKF